MSDSDLYDSSNSLEEKCLRLAKKLIFHCKEPCSRMQYLRDINSDLIVLLFESITNHTIPDLLVCTNKEEEAHNVQAVIDTLSLDLLGISLSHITGEDVVAGNLIAICNLLEVLEGIALHLNVKKDKTGSRRNLKRKICKRKNSVLQKKSPNHSSNGISGEKSGETSESTSGSFTLPTDSKFSVSSPSENALKKPTIISIKSQFTWEKDLTSEYPISSTSASFSPSSKVTMGVNSEAISLRRHVNEETDHHTYSKEKLQNTDSQLPPKPENKIHFRIEKVEQNKPLTVYKELSSVPLHFKKKTSKCSNEKKTQTSVKKEQVK